MSISLSKTYVAKSDADVTARISETLKRVYADTRNATKSVARAIGRDPRAVKAWMHGECAPSLASAIELAAHCDELADEINRLILERRRHCSQS